MSLKDILENLIHKDYGFIQDIKTNENFFNFFISNIKHRNIQGAGASFSKKIAVLSALGEYIERFSLYNHDLEKIYGKYNELEKNNKLFFSNSNLKINIDSLKNENFVWYKFNSFEGESILINSQYIDFNCYGDTIFNLPTSTGTSCADTIELAKNKSLFELIERDLFNFFWISKEKLNAINLNCSLKSIRNEKLKNCIYFLVENTKINLKILIKKPIYYKKCFMIIVFIFNNIPPYLSVGSSCGQDFEKVLEKSLLESLHTFFSYPHLKRIKINDANEIDSFNKHSAFYMNNNYNHKLKWIMELKEINIPKNYKKKYDENFNEIIRSLYENSINIYWSDLTPNFFLKQNIYVFKVFSNDLMELEGNYLHRNYEHEKVKKIKNINLMPHPFP